jgi:hypothetical protein
VWIIVESLNVTFRTARVAAAVTRASGSAPATGTIALVGRWIELRRKLGLPAGGAPLFCSFAGKPLDLSNIRHLLPRLARKAGISRPRPRATPRVRS